VHDESQATNGQVRLTFPIPESVLQAHASSPGSSTIDFDSSVCVSLQRAKPRRISIEDKRRRKANPRPLLALEKWTIKKNDLVEITDGPDEGRRGRVLSRQWRDNTVVVEGVSVEVTEELDPESLNLWDPQWQRKEGTPQPVHFQHVSLIDPTTNERTDVDWEKRSGIWTRISRSTGAGMCAD
jgi:ribosomal protein L24